MSVTLERERKTPLTVKIVTMGKGITQYVANDSMTLGELLKELEIPGSVDVRVNGRLPEQGYHLADADQILIVPKIRGGA